MAETKNVFAVGTRVSIYKFDPSEITVDAHLNGRHELPDVEWLPVIPTISVAPSLREINKRNLTKEPLPILATYFRGNEREGFVANIAENRYRNSTTPLDDATNIQRLFAWQMDEKQIAAVYFPAANGDGAALKKAVAWVKKTAKLSQLSPEAEQAVKDGRIKPSAAVRIAEMAAEAQRELVEGKDKITPADIAKAAGKPVRLTTKQVREELDNVVSDGSIGEFKLPPVVLDWLQRLRDRM